jgi:primosomal protein N'
VVEISIINKKEIGVVLKKIPASDIHINISKIKPLISIKNHKVFLDSYRVELLQWIAKHYFTQIHNSTNLFFPKNLRNKIKNNKINEEIEKNNISNTYTYNHKATLSKAQNKTYENIKKTKNNKILLY